MECQQSDARAPVRRSGRRARHPVKTASPLWSSLGHLALWPLRVDAKLTCSEAVDPAARASPVCVCAVPRASKAWRFPLTVHGVVSFAVAWPLGEPSPSSTDAIRARPYVRRVPTGNRPESDVHVTKSPNEGAPPEIRSVGGAGRSWRWSDVEGSGMCSASMSLRDGTARGR